MKLMRKLNKSLIRTREFHSLGDVELAVYKDDGSNYSFSLEDWQTKALQQILGIEEAADGTLTMFSRKFVEERVKKMGELVIVVDEEEEPG